MLSVSLLLCGHSYTCGCSLCLSIVFPDELVSTSVFKRQIDNDSVYLIIDYLFKWAVCV